MERKFLFFVVLMALSVTYGYSQTERGKFMAGGSTELSYSSVKTTIKYDGETLDESDDNLNSFNFKPSFGYFIIDNLALTASLEYTSQKEGSDKKKLADFQSRIEILYRIF